MRSPLTWALALAGTAAAAAVSSNGSSETPPSTWKRDNFCASVQDAANAFMKKNPGAQYAKVLPSLAINCLKSVPLHKEEDLALLNYLELYVNFQSTLKTLANPPEGYLIPGVDVIKGFGQIRAKLMNDKYDNQLDFAFELNNIFNQAADGHFKYPPAILDIFDFKGTFGVVSAAKTTTDVPKIYLTSDLVKAIKEDTDISNIVRIGGVRVEKFLEKHAFMARYRDPDTKYNWLFDNAVNRAKSGKPSGFKIRDPRSAPDEEKIEFANGDPRINKIWAILPKSSIDHIGTPDSIHKNFELPPKNWARTNASTADSTTATVVKRGATRLDGVYPEPLAFHKNQWVSGYFIKDDNYKDVAVLVVPEFEPWGKAGHNVDIIADLEEARRTTAEFLKLAKEKGKKKLIIDVQGNAGGWLEGGFQMYKQLFPQADGWDGTRIRAHEALYALMRTAKKVDKKLYVNLNDSPLNKDREPYKHLNELYGPKVISGEDVTNLLRYKEFKEAKVEGEQPFAAKDIVVITDGRCASTCAVFVSLLSREKDVRTIAFGGRPLEAPMQAIGGVRGYQQNLFNDLRNDIEDIIEAAKKDKESMDRLKKSWGVIPDTHDPPLQPDLNAGSFNYRNAYARNNIDGYPDQFVYEAANCRLFYDEFMFAHPPDIWTAAADVAWRGAKCAPGSTTNEDGTISDNTVKYSPAVKGSSYTNGPGSPGYKGAYEPHPALKG